MQLKSFRVTNFRSIQDSGEIRIDKITPLVGRNESGKSNLLLALASLNPAEGIKDLKPIKDFPRDRHLHECNDATPVVSTEWQLETSDIKALDEILGEGHGLKTVTVGRYYKATRWVQLGLQAPKIDQATVKAALKKVEPIISVAIEKMPDEHKKPTETALNGFKTTAQAFADKEWSKKILPTCKTLREAFVRAGATIPDNAEEQVTLIEEMADNIVEHEKNTQAARNKIIELMPTFVYVAEFPDLSGHQNINEYVQRRNENQLLTEKEENFEKLSKVAGFDPKELQRISHDHETRNQIVNRASAVVTKELKRLWKDRDLKVRFNIDGAHLETLISDPNNTYDVEVNLDERSRGFRWFFSFYVTFSADTDGGDAEGAIILLDEPGLFLHATSQDDLLQHLRDDFQNQIVYTTHSPFMVPSDEIECVRTVNISQDKGTFVNNDPAGDSRTLFPLQAALGYQASQTLFIGKSNLVVEGVTDFWILSSVSDYLRESSGTALPQELIITPAAGAQRVSYMAALLASQSLDVMILLDDEKAGREAKNELLKSKLVRENNVTLVSEAFPKGAVKEADIEDLIDADVYTALVKESYKAELKGKTLTLNNSIPRIVKRYEEAFTAAGLEFNKTRPARLFMTKMGLEPDEVVTKESKERFENLFQLLASRLEAHKKASRKPFS